MDDYMDSLVEPCKNKGYEKEQALIIGILSGCEQAYEHYGSEEKAFAEAAKIVKESSSPEEAIGKFAKTFLNKS